MPHEFTALSGQPIVVDLLAPAAPGMFLAPDRADFDEYVSCYEKAGVTWVSFTVAIDFDRTVEAAIKRIAHTRRFFMERPERFVLIEKMADVWSAKRAGKLAVNFNFQGTNPLGGDLELVELYKRLGVHHMLMAYNQKNSVGDGCHERTDAGLSRYGIQLVQEMNRVGMVVDVSHTGYRTAMDVFEIASGPVIFSHSGCRQLYDHERNIRDDQIRACARSGGVVGLIGLGFFMSESGQDISAQAIVKHIEHVADLVGPEHAGLGLDYVRNTQAMMAVIKKNSASYADSKGSYDAPEMHSASPAVIAEIAAELLRKNYPETVVRGILGENWVRVFQSIIG